MEIMASGRLLGAGQAGRLPGNTSPTQRFWGQTSPRTFTSQTPSWRPLSQRSPTVKRLL